VSYPYISIDGTLLYASNSKSNPSVCFRHNQARYHSTQNRSVALGLKHYQLSKRSLVFLFSSGPIEIYPSNEWLLNLHQTQGEDERSMLQRNLLPFGGGIRLCVGAEFSKVLISLFLHSLVTNYRYTYSSSDQSHEPWFCICSDKIINIDTYTHLRDVTGHDL
jgi:hypothetical protein